MNVSTRTEPSNGLIDRATQTADDAIKSTQRVANQAFDGLAGTVEDVRQHATPLLNQASDQAGALAQRGVKTVRDTSQQLRDRALQASESTVNYIKDEPVKAMLITAATGAALMALVGLMGRSRH